MNPEHELTDILGPGGLLDLALTHFLPRPSQLQMAENIHTALQVGELLAVEAGTGTGKTFAYLIPSILLCREQPEARIVMATSTIHLQHQIFDREIPLLCKILGVSVSAAILKGRTNYICLRKLQYQTMKSQKELTDDSDRLLSDIRKWVTETETGMLSEFSKPIPTGIRQDICSEADSCLKYQCAHRHSCFVLKARKVAADSQLIIVNQHLLFADIIMRESEQIADEQQAILPPYDYLIIDEAHNLEKNATSYFTTSIDRMTVERLLYDLVHYRGRQSFGVLTELSAFHPDMKSCIQHIRTHSAKLQQELLAMEQQALLLLKQGSQLLIDTKYLEQESRYEQFRIVLGNIDGSLLTLDTELRKCLEQCREDEHSLDYIQSARFIGTKLRKASRLIKEFTALKEINETIFWLERMGTSTQAATYLHATPLSTADSMREQLIDRKQAIIFTSATLSVGEDFRYFEQSVGIDESYKDRYRRLVLSSPFNFKKHLFLGIPSDVPSPPQFGAAESDSAYIIAMTEMVERLVLASEGGTLILFTSYRMLQQVLEHLQDELPETIPLLYQGQMDRVRLLSRFRQESASILLATDSFWEGVDIPGNSLRSVIITRLPFKVPTHPVTRARYDAVEQRGGNPFMTIAIPDTALKLKQGLGRLLRNDLDRGGVFILDSRILTKFYGRILIQALPESVLHISASERLIELFEDFLYT